MDYGPNALKRPSSPIADDSPSSKKHKPHQIESPALYSDAVRKKLAATSRTGQACDRCKERKMKCDTDKIACAPCRSKGLRCYTTDRVTGQARERGQTDRAEGELSYLRDQLHAYQSRYGPLGAGDPPPPRQTSDIQNAQIPSARYVGWPAPDHIEPLCKGPINATKVDIMDGVIDVADFDCDIMREPPRGQCVFNASRTSIVSTVFGYQRIDDPKLPPKQEAVSLVESFLVVMSQYYPVVHRPTFRDLVNRFYDHPTTVTIPERVQVMIVLAIMNQQMATRNHATSVEMFEKSHRYLHYALGFYRDVYHDISLKSMQALSLVVLYFRNLPKPGVSWSFSHQVLVRTIELQYHRDPDKVQLPPEEQSLLAKEIRKRVFHAVLGVCVNTGCRVGLPAPWQFQHIDVPLPLQITDEEISNDGLFSQRSGQCDFHPAIHLSKLIPLFTELYNNILAVRRPASDYLRTVEALNTKIVAWRQDWDDSMKAEQPMHINLHVATLLIEQWTAEYQLTLHHPACCTSTDPQVIDRHLDICHKAAKRLLSAFHTSSTKYKGVDFTWHSTAPYAMGFGITLHCYRKRLAQVSKEQFEAMCNELKGWMSLIAYADVVLKTGNLLQHYFKPLAQSLEDDYRRLLDGTGTPSMATFSAVNGSGHRLSQGQLKSETPTQSTSVLSQLNGHTISSPAGAHHFGAPPPTPPFSTTQTPNNVPPQWGTSGTNSQYGSISAMAQSFAPYSHPGTSDPQYQIPVSLAPLLNNPGGFYATYAGPSQATTQTSGSQPLIDYSLMAFSPTHYHDHTGPVSWPLITLPPGQQ